MSAFLSNRTWTQITLGESRFIVGDKLARRLIEGLFICGLLVFYPLAGLATERVALVIGNGNYKAVPRLENPENDATDIAAALHRLGFVVELHHNLRGDETNRALRNFSRQSQDADMAVLYFAGHGLEINNQNYLMPIDAQIERASDVVYEANQMSQLLGAVAGAKTLRLVLLDACRNNPFLLQMADASTRSLGRGLVRIEPPGGVLVSYAAKGGTVAYDGKGRNSPYAAALLKHLEEPGLEIGKLFRRVRDSVYNSTEGLQEPFTYGSLPAKDIYLAAARPPEPTEDIMLQAFARADITNTAEGWTEFLELYSQYGLNTDVIRRAYQRRSALRQQSTQPVQSGSDSPLIRTCDGLAADPDDQERPSNVPGVAASDIDTSLARQACILAVSSHPGHLRSLYQLSRALMSGPEPQAAETYLRLSADAGYVAAQVALASSIVRNAPIFSQPTEAFALLETATDAGSRNAPRLLADLTVRNPWYTAGRNRRTPVELYRLSADRGDVDGMFETGYRLLSDTLASHSEKAQGLIYLETAANAGNRKAMVRLSNYYFMLSDTKSLERARVLLTQAAQAGDYYSLARLIRESQNGVHGPHNLKEANKWLKVGAEQGNTAMMVEYAYYLETGHGERRSATEAAKYYYMALIGGNQDPIRRASSEWDRDTVRALQGRLITSEKALFTGPIDGMFGPGTRAAMARLCGCNVSTRRVLFANMFFE